MTGSAAVTSRRIAMGKPNGSAARRRPADTGGSAGDEVAAPPVGSANKAAREEPEDSIVAGFLAATDRMAELINTKADEAARAYASPEFDFDFDRQIRDLKHASAAVRRLIAPLEELKK